MQVKYAYKKSNMKVHGIIVTCMYQQKIFNLCLLYIAGSCYAKTSVCYSLISLYNKFFVRLHGEKKFFNILC
jgi:hypothetical protein